MDFSSFKVEIAEHIAIISFNRPQKANSLDLDTWNEMQSVFEHLHTVPEVRVIILRGEGKHFCAGMDLQTLMGIPTSFNSDCQARQRDKIRKFVKEIQQNITSIEDCRKPVIAAVHGACVGGGLNIISACDIRYSTDDAFYSIKEIDLGLVADIGILQRLPTILNPGLVAELAYTGRKFSGIEAEKIGLVNQSFKTQESMMEKVMQLATEIASKSPLVVRGTKEMLLYKRDHSVQDSLDNMANWNAAMLLSNDIYKAMEASMAKTVATFDD